MPPAGIEEFFAAIDPRSPTGGAGVFCLRDEGLFEEPRKVRLLLLAGVRRVESSVRLDRAATARGVLRPHESASSVAPAGLYRYQLRGPDVPFRLFRDRTLEREYPGKVLQVERLEWPRRAGKGRISVKLRSAEAGMLFVPMTWMPGWKFRIDRGEWRPTERALHAFQALPLPKGKHMVEMRYAPWSFNLGLLGSFLGFLACLALAWIRLRRHRKKGIPSLEEGAEKSP